MPSIDLTHVNKLRDGYNRYYVLEKECALRNVRLAALGFDPVASTPEHFAQWIGAEIAKWGKVIRDGNIALQ